MTALFSEHRRLIERSSTMAVTGRIAEVTGLTRGIDL